MVIEFRFIHSYIIYTTTKQLNPFEMAFVLPTKHTLANNFYLTCKIVHKMKREITRRERLKTFINEANR